MDNELEALLARPLIEDYKEMFQMGDFSFITEVEKEGVIKRHEKQQTALCILTDGQTKEFGYGGAAGGAKSWTGCAWLVFMCLCFPDTRWFIGREELTRLMASTYVTFQRVCKAYGIKQEIDWKFNGQYHYIQFTNGSRIDLLDLKFVPRDPFYERYGSTEYTGGWIEEGGEVNFGAYDTLRTRIGRYNNEMYGIVPKLLVTLNPKKNWCHQVFWKPFKAGTLELSVKFLQALATDNPHVDAGYIEQLREIKDKVKKQRLLFGNFDYDDDDDALMEYDAINDLFTNQHVERGKKYMTVDVARFGKDESRIYVWDNWLVIERVVLKKKSITEVADKVKEKANKHKIPMSQVIADEDGVGCLTKGTMVLTGEGWKKVEDITIKDMVYSKDESGNLSLYPVIANTLREETDVIKLSTGIEFSYSHFLPLKTRKEYPFKMVSFDWCIDRGRVYTDSYLKWDGHCEDIIFDATEYRMPNGGKKNCNNSLVIDAFSFAKFIGWFTSEGSLNGNYIRITQNLDSPEIDGIRNVLSDCGFNYYEKMQSNGRTVDFLIRQKALYKWLKDNCYVSEKTSCYTKRVPEYIRSANVDVIKAFLACHNAGDGYYHHDMSIHITTSLQLAYDIQECMMKAGIRSNIRIKQRAGSKSKIGNRVITRTCDCYMVSEIKQELTIGRPEVVEVRSEGVYNLEINSPTKLYLVLFDGRTPFFVHNGGCVDILRCKGFVNNSSPLENPKTKQPQNYENLKTQCSYMASTCVNERTTGFAEDVASDTDFRDRFIEEAEQVKKRDADSDGKLKIVKKEDVKELLGRSPDDWDAFMMRQYFELKPKGGNNSWHSQVA